MRVKVVEKLMLEETSACLPALGLQLIWRCLLWPHLSLVPVFGLLRRVDCYFIAYESDGL